MAYCFSEGIKDGKGVKIERRELFFPHLGGKTLHRSIICDILLGAQTGQRAAETARVPGGKLPAARDLTLVTLRCVVSEKGSREATQPL